MDFLYNQCLAHALMSRSMTVSGPGFPLATLDSRRCFFCFLTSTPEASELIFISEMKITEVAGNTNLFKTIPATPKKCLSGCGGHNDY